jgi:hypothetical protein
MASSNRLDSVTDAELIKTSEPISNLEALICREGGGLFRMRHLFKKASLRMAGLSLIRRRGSSATG